ncbi:aminotransferase class III-fold pyridoxal phosphate-dependent enzyme [Roseococcus sp. SDR]|uniref:aspartate aminotransferase family protein n=1 Tax=Roseococcus sp. SDR TaxID=2835532 RepID=UPI001BD16768|nr:aminotransferase class III-fold pyridoxal phosphate-dependent enzyme [Roseococcus sp. SDR]MBS7792322.1 aminotransferase class III-fold pyridoxal phosphate-dependent enzyme [Roseococcus sp. SDR]MBV1847636.1 aminotransferase class III-fold pyridoxal phosphate-dependent enzyme [Roseococcus sp. SDR]
MPDALLNTSLDAALADARERFVAANPQSLARHVEATAVMPGGNTRTVLFHTPFPLTMARGAGCRLWDADGHEYVDLLGEYTAGLYGHSNPVIRAALDGALDGGWNLGGHGVMEARLARVICERFPSMELVRFTNSGTEANLMAIATALAVTRRRRVLVFEGGYHGGVLYFGGGGIPINAPHDWVLGRYNDLGLHLDESIGAIIVEPMLGSGGCIPATAEFLALLRAEAKRVGAVLIFDEVMTSRMSAGGQQARLGITPDMTTLGKYIGGGMSFGAFGGRADIMARYDPRRADAIPHAGTFNNNVLTMAAGVAGLTRIFTPEAAEALFERGERLRAQLNALAPGLPLRWTGLGSLMTVHFQREPIASPADLRPDAGLRELFFLDMLERGFYLARRGMLALSLEIGPAEAEGFVAAVGEFIASRGSLLRGE